MGPALRPTQPPGGSHVPLPILNNQVFAGLVFAALVGCAFGLIIPMTPFHSQSELIAVTTIFSASVLATVALHLATSLTETEDPRGWTDTEAGVPDGANTCTICKARTPAACSTFFLDMDQQQRRPSAL